MSVLLGSHHIQNLSPTLKFEVLQFVSLLGSLPLGLIGQEGLHQLHDLRVLVVGHLGFDFLEVHLAFILRMAKVL